MKLILKISTTIRSVPNALYEFVEKCAKISFETLYIPSRFVSCYTKTRQCAFMRELESLHGGNGFRPAWLFLYSLLFSSRFLFVRQHWNRKTMQILRIFFRFHESL
jgi:hypothetical protein